MSSNTSMPLTLRAAGEHPEIGILVDNKGIAFDLETGRSLKRAEVDARVAQFQRANPGTQVAGLEKKRGGVAGFYDKNKKVIRPIAEIGAGLIGGPALAAATGAAMKGLDRKGKSGIGLDAGQALRGGVEGGLLGYGAQKVAGAIGSKGVGGAIKSGITKLGSGAKAVGNTLLGGSAGVASGGDLLRAGLGLIPAALSYNRGKEFEKAANEQLNNASAGNATMAEIAKALIARGSAPSGAPDLSHLIDDRNPYAKRLRPMIAAPVNDPAAAAPGAGVTATPGAMYDPATFGGLKPGRGVQSGASVTATPGATYDPATFYGQKRPGAQTGASVAATPGETWNPAVGIGGAKRPGTLLGASVAGVQSGALPPGQTMASLMEMARKNAPGITPGGAMGYASGPGVPAGPNEVRGAMPAGQTMASLMEMAKQNAPKPQSTLLGALPAGSSMYDSASVAGVKSDTPINPFSFGGAKPWKVEDVPPSVTTPRKKRLKPGADAPTVYEEVR